MSLCRYSKSLGTPKEGIHSYRIFNIAIVDVFFTVLLALLITYVYTYLYIRQSSRYNTRIRVFVFVLICLFLLGIVLHRLFCVKTTIDRLITI